MSTQYKDFSEFGLPVTLLEDLTRLGFNTPTPIQAQGIPAIVSGKDILAIAPTGTGKTGAFAIPALANVLSQSEKQVLVLAPTRELAAQIFQFFNQVGVKSKSKGALLVGGESFGRQYAAWNDGVDFIVATPGRLMDHVGRGLDLKHIGMLILDEVDRMLDMGFAPQIEEIAKTISTDRQTLFFSATLPAQIQKLAQRYLKEPVKITVLGTAQNAPKIKEERISASGYDKNRVLIETVNAYTGKMVVFTRTQMGTERVAEILREAGIEPARLHGGRTQADRKRSLDAFRNGIVRVLVATDIAARGIDVADIEVVINFDKAATQEDHLHRIGRTGRCGKEGIAITFVDGRNPGGGGRNSGGRGFGGRPGGGGFGRRPFMGEDRFQPREPRPSPRPFKNDPPFKVVPAAAAADNRAEKLLARERNAQAEMDSNPRNFGKKPRPEKPFMRKRHFAHSEKRRDHSGSVRFFRAGEPKKDHGEGYRREYVMPEKPKKMPPSFERGSNKASVRRNRPAAPTV